MTGKFRNAMSAGLGLVVLKLAVGLIIVLAITGRLQPMLEVVRSLWTTAVAESATWQRHLSEICDTDQMRPQSSGNDGDGRAAVEEWRSASGRRAHIWDLTRHQREGHGR